MTEGLTWVLGGSKRGSGTEGSSGNGASRGLTTRLTASTRMGSARSTSGTSGRKGAASWGRGVRQHGQVACPWENQVYKQWSWKEWWHAVVTRSLASRSWRQMEHPEASPWGAVEL